MITAKTSSLLSARWRVAAAASMLALLQLPALAQVQPPPGTAIDPPGRVARLNLIEGPVSFAPAPSGDENDNSAWTQAQLNRPLTAGDRLWTDQRARSELHIGSTTVRMNAQTSLDFLALDDNTTQLRLAQGTANLRVRNMYPGQRLEVDTPNLAFVVSQPGDYRLDVNPATNTTRVVSQSGAGVIYGDSGTPVNLGNQQQVSFGGTNLAPAGPGASALDAFDQWAIARHQAEDRSVTARYVPRETVGYQQLDSYGDWTQDPSYGAVWLPRAVPANWAPYRAGHWSWIRPWGWTWIDDAPWGFAPFHYGRWAQIGPRWAWVPGRLAPRPVYAPALVAFVGGSSGGVSWNVSIGGGSRPALGWFPLAPGEAFRPAYRTSPGYVTQVNHNIVVNNIVNQTNVTNVTNVYRYARTPAAVTAVSAADFARGRPVASNVALTAADLGRARLVESGRGIPQRPESREAREAGPATNALPPVAANTRPVVNLQGDRRGDGRANGRDGRDARDNDRRDGRDGLNDNPARAQAQGVATAPVSAAPAPAGATAASPAANAAAKADRSAQDAQRRARSEQERQQRDARQAAAQPGEESLGQRALREQAQRNAPPAATRQAPDRNAGDSIEQARRAQQQLQRDQQRQQRELTRQQDAQRRQSEESLGQRAQREQAASRQQQAKEQADAKRAQEQQARQQQSQQQQQQAQQQSQERQKERADDQRDAREGRQGRDQQRQQQPQRRDTP